MRQSILVDLFPESWRAGEHLATTYQQAGDAAQARHAYQVALRLLQAAPMPAEERARHEERLEAQLHTSDQ